MGLKSIIKDRRSQYNLTNKIDISEEALEDILATALKYVPSSFNSESTRLVLLLDHEHQKLWNIVKETLKKKMSSQEAFEQTENKINGSFASGYGTILFYEDQSVVKQMQDQFPSYASSFPIYSEHTSGMHQFAIWTMLREVGIGASLQHYQPLIDDEVAKTWSIDPNWKLIAQMPFGIAENFLGEKEANPVDDRLKVFK